MYDLLVVTGLVLLAGAQELAPATLEVSRKTGRITKVWHKRRELSDYPDLEAAFFVDAGARWVLPGLVDLHVHLDDPGRTEWEGFLSGTSAAASGGVTTLMDMPLNSYPPTTTAEHLETKVQAASGKCRVDVVFCGGLVPGNKDDIAPLAEAGVPAFKCFLIDSGIAEFPPCSADELRLALPEIQEAGAYVMVHAEKQQGDFPPKDPKGVPNARAYATFLASRPQAIELAGIELLEGLLEEHPGVGIHIAHLSAGSALPGIRKARAKGLPLSVETCYHYLFHTAERIPDGNTLFKSCPPIREAANRDKLWQALVDGDIDYVVSDHSPCTIDLKRLDEGNFLTAWGGVASLGLGLAALWTEGQRRGITIAQIVQWCSTRPAAQLNLATKGALAVDMDADFFLFDPTESIQVSKKHLYFKNKYSAYEGFTLQGVVTETYLRGYKVFDSASGFEKLGPPRGALLLRKT